MSSSPLSGRQRDALMQHLDSLFALAQIVSPDAEQAVRLVEATFRRAFSTSLRPAGPSEKPAPPVGGGSSDPPPSPFGGGSADEPASPVGGGSADEPASPVGGGSSDEPASPNGGGSSDEPASPIGGRSSDEPAFQVGGGPSDEPASQVGGGPSDEPASPVGGGPSDEPASGADDESSRKYAPPAEDEAADFESGEEARIWLYRLMMKIRKERAEEGAGLRDMSAAPAESSIELADLRRRLAEEFIDRALPPAFATLPSEQRVLLMLCDVERMGCKDAGRVLALDPAVSCARLEEAHVSLHRALYADATDVERHLLDTGLPANWKRAALQRMAESRLVVMPPTLRPSVVSIFKSVSHPGQAGDGPSEIGEADKSPRAGERLWPGLLKKFAAVLSLIAVAGLLGYGFTYFTRHEPDVNLISLSAQQAQSVEASFETTSPEQAERYIYDRLGSRVTLPTIAEASLQGVSIRSLVDGAEVPILLFQDASTGRPITVYVYSYAFLDRHQNELVLERDILRQIEAEGNFDLHDLGQEKALVWRNRDDIFVAITSGDADALRGRIAYPS